MADGVFIEQQDFRHELDFANLGVRFVRKPRRCGVIRRGELPVISPRFSTTSFSAQVAGVSVAAPRSSVASDSFQ